MKLAEVNAMAKGPIDELLDALNEALEDLGEKAEKAAAEWSKETSKHN
jgi:hypothetical protein